MVVEMALESLERRATGAPMITQMGMIILMWVGVAVSVAFVVFRTVGLRPARREESTLMPKLLTTT